MARPIKVFVSYSRHEREVDRVTAICDWINEISLNKIEFVIDKSLGHGDNVHDFERSISSYRAVLIIGTRKYKQKIETGDYGVSREHRYLMEALQSKKINVFTIISESQFEEVFPSDMKGFRATDFSGVMHDSEWRKLSNNTRKMYQAEANSLVIDILALNEKNILSKSNISKIRQKLFFEQKHESIADHIDDETFNKIFVKTSCYNAVINKSSYLLIGRKGSGKSFLTDYFTRNPIEDNTISIFIHFRLFKLSNIYLMGSASRLSPDIGKIISESDLFECSWSLIFYISCIIQTYIEVKSDQIDYPRHKMLKIENFLEQSGCLDKIPLYGEDVISVQRLIDWCVEKVYHTVNSGIEILDNDYAKAISGIQSLVDPLKVVPAIIGLSVIEEFNEIVKQKSPTFLITVDGFDSKFDNFRRDTNSAVYESSEKLKRVEFEINWLTGLIESTQSIINPPRGPKLVSGNAIYRLLVTLPRDRFIEVQRLDRDAFRLRHKYVEIRWSGPELMNLIRKRLEVYYAKDCKSDLIDEKLFEAIEWICSISKNLTFMYNKNRVEIDLFSYFLRHSFWRPRDILYHVSTLIEEGERYKKIKRQITVEKIREIVKNSCSDIIKAEFIGEFETIFPKIQRFLGLFYGKTNELTHDEIFSIIGVEEIRLSSGDILDTIEDKIDFLYEIGFIGIITDQEFSKKVGFKRRESFSFSDSIDVYRTIPDQIKRNLSWIIHPIFSEYLGLSTVGSNFVLRYDMEYLISSD